MLKEQGEQELAALPQFSRATINKLRDDGIVELEERDAAASEQFDFTPSDPPALMAGAEGSSGAHQRNPC